MSKVKELQTALQQKVWAFEQAKEAELSLKKELEGLVYLQSVLERVNIFFRLVFDKKKDELRQRFEKLANYGLEKIFGAGIRLKIEQKVKANRVYNDIKIERLFDNDWVSLDIIKEDAGGVVDVVSLLMRILVMLLMVPRPRKLLILDEPCKMVSADLRPKISQLLKDLCDKLDIQIIMVTHSPELTENADIVYKLSNGAVLKAQ